jgi:hypothetical protein
MRVKFYVSHKDVGVRHYSHCISESLTEGIKLYGDDIETVHNGSFEEVDPNVDVACVWGLMGNAIDIVNAYVNRNKRAIIFDKGLIRHMGVGGHYRVGIDGPSPVKYMMRVPRSFERFERWRVQIKPRVSYKSILRQRILYCGSSQKYCNYYNLGDANEYAEDIFRQIKGIGKKIGLVYRPKPSWQGAREILDTEFSGGKRTLSSELEKCNLLITHGSAAAVEAILAGVPAITLGPCAAQYVSERVINNETIHDPFFPSDQARWQWLCALSYCQWSEDEMKSGEAWGFIRNEIMELNRI